MLSAHFDVTIMNPDAFAQANLADEFDLMIGIHATRSSNAAAYWVSQKGDRENCPSLIMTLSGTDLYLDYPENKHTELSLKLASKLIVLQSLAPRKLPQHLANKCEVIYQSCPSLPALAKPAKPMTFLMVGHLRDVKDPLTFIKAAEALQHRNDLNFIHIGQSLDDQLAEQATLASANLPNYQWLGEVSAPETRHWIQKAHALVHASKQEGGAHVIMEAVTAGTPVIASRMDGNLGMLGEDYPAYFEVGNFQQLAELIARFADQPESAWVLSMQHTCNNRAALFAPELEASHLLSLVQQQITKSS